MSNIRKCIFKKPKRNPNQARHPHNETDGEVGVGRSGLTVPRQAGGGDEALAQGLLSLVRYGPVVGEDPALQLIQVGRGELHAAARAVAVLVIAPL